MVQLSAPRAPGFYPSGRSPFGGKGSVWGISEVDLSMKKIPWLLIGLAGIEAVPVVALISQPRDCECDQSRLAPIPASLPQPEERSVIAPMLAERVSSAASDGSVVVHAGVGEVVYEGFAPTVSVSST